MTANDWADPAEEEERAAERLASLRAALYGSGDLHKIPPPIPLVDGWLDQDSLAWIVGSPGHGKSFVALDLGGCVANGIDWHGYPTKQAPVLYVVLERAGGIHGRVMAWEDYYQSDMGVTFLVPPGPLHIVRDAPALAQITGDLKAGLVIIDTQNRGSRGLDENSNVDMGLLIGGLEQVQRATRACVAVVHHTAREGRTPRGHGSIDGAADAVIRVARDGDLIKVESGKANEHAKAAALSLAATPHAGGLVLAHGDGAERAVTDSERKVLAALRTLVATKENVTHTDLKQYVQAQGVATSTFGWALKRLVERRRMVVRKGNSYRLTDPTQGTLA